MELLEKIESSPAGDYPPDEGEETVITSYNKSPDTVKQRLKSFIKTSVKKLKSFLGR
jgi:hypothetical protein